MVESIQHTPTAEIIPTATRFVKKMLLQEYNPSLTFHNWSLTEDIVNSVEVLTKIEQCDQQTTDIIILAALFLNTGFSKNYSSFKAESIATAEQFLAGQKTTPKVIEKVSYLINTIDSTDALDSIETKILHDATTAYLGKKKLRKKLKDQRREIALQLNVDFTDKKWKEKNYNLLDAHSYYTIAAQNEYDKRKQKNLKKISKGLDSVIQKNKRTSDINKNKAARMIFKTALRNHIDLTSIADQKANIMLSICAVILTLGMPLFATYMMDRQLLVIPAVVFLLTCALTMIFATIATRPIQTDGETDLSNLYSGKSNLFFFGNFYNIKLNQYQKAVKKVMESKGTLENSIINDLYFLGQSLGSKFKTLRICYTIFVVGISLTIISFFIAYLMFESGI